MAGFVIQRKRVVKNEGIFWLDISSKREYTKMFPNIVSVKQDQGKKKKKVIKESYKDLNNIA